jgi:hypothetical protein
MTKEQLEQMKKESIARDSTVHAEMASLLTTIFLGGSVESHIKDRMAATKYAVRRSNGN